MTKLRVIIANGDKIYAVPVEVIEQHPIDSVQLKAAQAIFEEESDVTGQGYSNGYTTNAYGEAWKLEGGEYKRAPWRDELPSSGVRQFGNGLIEY
ncbi:hypothetical protein PSEUDO9AZ_40188 [Pseudomonas sp. 9AZ]|uniref:hypothetical protein n=1 Tax=Pseudomonas sp. 9AZ TaxID=2653168 RepID=UPI0012F008FB|nr:hypothetical protein [Pseudomonas sp. 9AZ]VXD00193.1 hypothetical protein PSEUDO9AZ_40188 [Pseudomonas sp. 9AZ]